jgi:hypothetical protein
MLCSREEVAMRIQRSSFVNGDLMAVSEPAFNLASVPGKQDPAGTKSSIEHKS